MKDRVYTESLLTRLARTKGASDLIITTGKPPQLRVWNELVELHDEDILTAADTKEICTSLLTEERAEQLEKDKEIDISAFVKGVGRFRVNMYYQRGQMAMAVRVVLIEIPSFEELRLPSIVKRFAMLPNGLVLITGPVGSGKSTTVAAMVDYINKTRRCHIVCIEDPIEFDHVSKLSTVDQREVGIDTHSFGESLRRVLRQSMDVVVIGEVRDRISAQAAMTLAETGHLTIATLHTRGTVASVNRLIDMFPPEQGYQIRTQLAASLGGVMWQQLLPASQGEGLIVACEILYPTPAVRALVRNNRTEEIYSAIQTGKQYHMCTMEQSMQQLVTDGLINSDWAEHHVADLIVAGGM